MVGQGSLGKTHFGLSYVCASSETKIVESGAYLLK